MQIRLAQLQTDVQIYLSALFGFDAILTALIIGLIQAAVSSPSDKVLDKLLFLIVAAASVGIMETATSRYINKMRAARDEMEKLKKRYVW